MNGKGKQETVAGLIRHLLTFGGGYIVAGGWVPAVNMEEAVAAVMTLIGVGWSAYMKLKSPQEPLVLEKKEPTL